MIWVINSNSNTCRIYHYQKAQSRLELLKEIEHPENKLRSGDLTSDGPGKYKASGGAHGAYEPSSDAKTVKIDNFMREVAKELNAERLKSSYERLIIIAPPQMHGMLMQHMDKHVKEMIIANIHKDLPNATDRDLLTVLETTPNF